MSHSQPIPFAYFEVEEPRAGLVCIWGYRTADDPRPMLVAVADHATGAVHKGVNCLRTYRAAIRAYHAEYRALLAA